MIIPRFTYHEPATLTACLSILGDHGDAAAPLAGGTDLLVNMKKGLIRPAVLVSLARIGELGVISTDDNGRLRLGPMATMDTIASHAQIKRNFGILAQAAESVGSPLIRNRATIGGNLVTARPAADSHGPLICLDARVRLEKLSGAREIPVETFFRGPGETLKKPDEVLTEIIIDRPLPGSGGAYCTFGIRKTLEIGVVNVAVFLALGTDGMINHARVALGAVAPKTFRSRNTEKGLIGNRPDKGTIKRAAEAAARDCRPISDIRGSAEYRQTLVQVLTRRAIEDAVNQASSA